MPGTRRQPQLPSPLDSIMPLYSPWAQLVGTRSLVKPTTKPLPGISVTCLLAHADKHVFSQ